MTRWLEAARKADGVGSPTTKLTKSTEPRPPAPHERVSSILSILSEGGKADELDPDARSLLDFLTRDGPATYGAAARGLGWEVTRTARAEWRLRKSGRVTFDRLGRAIPLRAAG